MSYLIHSETTSIKPPRQFWLIPFLILLITLFISSSASGKTSTAPGIVHDINQTDEEKLTRIFVPYVFYTEDMELTFGGGGGVAGLQKGQAGLYATAFTSTNLSTAGYIFGNNFQLPFSDRLFVDPILSAGWFAKARDYISGNPDFEDEQAGSNDSDPENFVESAGWDNWFELKFKYIFPMGHSRESAISIYQLDRGILESGATGGGAWNPLKGGITYIQAKPFFRYRSFEFDSNQGSGRTNGVEFAVMHDNTNFPQNASTGSSQSLKVARDFGWFGSSSWTVIKGDFSKYFSLGETERFRQRVIALNLWVSDNISLESNTTPEGDVYSHRAPYYMGSSLGGFYRLKGYPQHRFSDKTAVYYSAEVRLIPEWNPLRRVSFLNFFDIDWIQFVGMIEAGRVDSSWSTKSFYSDLHYDAGIGIRVMARKVVCRFDMAFSKEGVTSWLMVGQSF